ncbi:hypothetical protein KCU92_g4207, partial [Aureobasidium melanogenum]
MSDLPLPSTDTVANDCEISIGGTCFLDLPLELREMIYDLSMPHKWHMEFPLPGEPKIGVMGINLLRSCKQIRQETHARVWFAGWTIGFPSNASSVNLRSATSAMNDLALAKIRTLNLDITIGPDALSPWGPIDLEILPSFKALCHLNIVVYWGRPGQRTSIKPAEDPSESVFLTGLVIQILPQIPQRVLIVMWDLFIWGDKLHVSQALESIAKKYEHLQGSNYLPKIRNLYGLSSSALLQPNTPVRFISPGLQFTP